MIDEKLIRLKTLVDAGLPLPVDLANWLISAIEAFERGQCKTLCKALGLRQRGLSSLSTRAKLNRRNELLRQLANGYDGTPWERAAIMADVIRRWPSVGLDEKLRYTELMRSDIKVPATASRIYQIINK